VFLKKDWLVIYQMDLPLELLHYADKNNALLSPSLDRTPVPIIKCIQQEKTGTNWQTVLNVVKYGEEQWKKILAVIEEM